MSINSAGRDNIRRQIGQVKRFQEKHSDVGLHVIKRVKKRETVFSWIKTWIHRLFDGFSSEKTKRQVIREPNVIGNNITKPPKNASASMDSAIVSERTALPVTIKRSAESKASTMDSNVSQVIDSPVESLNEAVKADPVAGKDEKELALLTRFTKLLRSHNISAHFLKSSDEIPEDEREDLLQNIDAWVETEAKLNELCELLTKNKTDQKILLEIQEKTDAFKRICSHLVDIAFHKEMFPEAVDLDLLVPFLDKFPLDKQLFKNPGIPIKALFYVAKKIKRNKMLLEPLYRSVNNEKKLYLQKGVPDKLMSAIVDRLISFMPGIGYYMMGTGQAKDMLEGMTLVGMCFMFRGIIRPICSEILLDNVKAIGEKSGMTIAQVESLINSFLDDLIAHTVDEYIGSMVIKPSMGICFD